MLCLAAVSFVVLNAVTFIYNKTSRQLKTKNLGPSSPSHAFSPNYQHRTNRFSSDSKLISDSDESILSIHFLHFQLS